MQLGDFLNTMAAKLGMQNDSDLVSLLSSPEISQAEIGDGFANKLNTGLMSLEGAKNNSEVLNHFKPIILKAADDKFAILAAKYGLESEFAGEKSTYRKIDLLESMLASKIADAEGRAQKAGGSTSEEIKQYKKALEDLQSQLQSVTAAKDKELSDLRASQAKEQLDMLVNLELNGKNYANAELGDTNVTIARALLDKALQERGAVLVNEGGRIAVKRADNTTLSLLDQSNNPVQFADFTNQLLADKHLLHVSASDDSPAEEPSPRRTATLFPPVVDTGKGGKDTSRFDAASAQSLADLAD